MCWVRPNLFNLFSSIRATVLLKNVSYKIWLIDYMATYNIAITDWVCCLAAGHQRTLAASSQEQQQHLSAKLIRQVEVMICTKIFDKFLCIVYLSG